MVLQRIKPQKEACPSIYINSPLWSESFTTLHLSFNQTRTLAPKDKQNGRKTSSVVALKYYGLFLGVPGGRYTPFETLCLNAILPTATVSEDQAMRINNDYKTN